MRWAVASLALLLMLAATPCSAQRGGCGLGLGLAALAEAEHLLAAPSPGLEAGRDQAAQASAQLHEARLSLQGCGCRRVAEQAGEAAGLAEQARSQASVADLRRSLDRARFSLRLARERAGRDGCS